MRVGGDVIDSDGPHLLWTLPGLMSHMAINQMPVASTTSLRHVALAAQVYCCQPSSSIRAHSTSKKFIVGPAAVRISRPVVSSSALARAANDFM